MDNQAVETTTYSLGDAVPPKDRRRKDDLRFLSLFRVGALTIGDRRELCLIRNVSAGGMMIRAYSLIDVGSRLSVELKHGEPVSGTVRWAENETIGVSFDRSIDVLSLISLHQDGPRPRMPRIEIGCLAWIREGAVVARVKAINISQGGLQVECGRDLSVGAEVVVTLNGLAPEPAIVKWREGHFYGLRFHRTLAIARLVGWLKTQQERLRAAG